MPIERFAGRHVGRSRAVAWRDLVCTVATARDHSGDITAQTRDVLEQLDTFLAEAGSSKARVMQATVYITDQAHKAAMNAVWLDWVDLENPPQRACVAVTLAEGELVEIVLWAARGED